MALATKCPHCHTVFRVALDQLKLRGGIVRCGACNEIFDGNAALVEPSAAAAGAAIPVLMPAPAAAPALDLELDLDEVAVQAQPPAAEPEPESVPDGAAQASGALQATGIDGADLAADPAFAPASTSLAPSGAAQPLPDPLPASAHRHEPAFDMPSEHIVAVALDDLHHFDDAPAPLMSAPGRDDSTGHAADRAADDAGAADLLTAAPDSALLTAGAGAAAGVRDGHNADDDGDQGAAPEFVRQAERRERTRGVARLAMIAGIPLLAFVLLAQGVLSLRNRLAADYPAMKPALQALCGPLGCTVELPRQIDVLAIEQGELQTLAPDTFSFVTVLRNQSRSVQAWPHIELVLNDAADKPVLRRVFAPRDYLARPADVAQGFGPRSEQSVKLYFQLDRLRASGYHIAIFHP